MDPKQDVMAKCPTCERDDFRNERMVKIHHKKAHGESIAGVELTCDYCGETYRVPPSTAERGSRFCSRECQTSKQSEEFAGENCYLHGVTGEDHPKYTGHEDYYGANWEQKREEALARDGHECVVCGVGPDEHRERHGCDLHVHHIQPIATYDTPEAANEVDNLITLCRPHHGIWEGIPVMPEVVSNE